MGDPRNVAHAKKVTQEKHHKAKAQPVKKSEPAAEERAPVQTAEVAKPQQTPDAAKLEKSLAVLANLKELEFHSRANIEKTGRAQLDDRGRAQAEIARWIDRRCLLRARSFPFQNCRAHRSLPSRVRPFEAARINFNLGSARASRAGDRAPAIANFLWSY